MHRSLAFGLNWKLYRRFNVRLRFYALSSLLFLLIACDSSIIKKPVTSKESSIKKTSRSIKPTSQPILRLDIGMHTARISSMDIDEAERFLITASYDKTLRLWSLKNGRLLRTLRPPIDQGHEGKLYAASISPDGNWIAAGGYTSNGFGDSFNIYLFDRASGKIKRRLSSLPNDITDLCFSPDGNRLAATLGGGGGLRVWSTKNGDLLGKFEKYGGVGTEAECDFAKNGWLVTSSTSGFVRLYDAGLQLISESEAPTDRHIMNAEFSPNGKWVAVLSGGSERKIDILSVPDLSFVESFEPFMTQNDDFGGGGLLTTTWSADSKRLFAGGTFTLKNRKSIAMWDRTHRGKTYIQFTTEHEITSIHSMSDGGLLVGTTAPAWLRFDANGKVIMKQQAVMPDMRYKVGENFRVSHDGQQVAFGLDYAGREPVTFNIRNRYIKSLASINQTSVDLSQPVIKGGDFKAHYSSNSSNTPYIFFKGGEKPNLSYLEQPISFAISPNGESLLIGTQWHLYRFDNNGEKLWKTGLPERAFGVNISGDGRLVVAALSDGTLRWYRYRDGKEMLALFINKVTKEWVLWTPKGYYDASPGGDRLVGWHVNNGIDHAADIYPASSFRESFYRPQVVANILTTLDEVEAVRLANTKSEHTQVERSITQSLPPLVELLSPVNGSTFHQAEMTIKYRLKNPTKVPINKLQLKIDGRPQEEGRGLLLQHLEANKVLEWRVSLPMRDLQLSLIAENRFGTSPPATIQLHWSGRDRGFVIKPKLYALVVGVSDYQDNKLDLRYAVKDAQDFAHVIKRQSGWLYQNVVVNTLLNPTSGELLDGLDWLRDEVTSKDVAMLFIAGHGVNDKDGDYYYLTKDTNVERLRRTAVEYHDFKKTLSALPGKTMAFIDTCHSGDIMGTRRGLVDINAVVNDLTAAENGVVVFASSTGKQYSLEDSSWGNGAFTKALVEGLNGEANYENDNNITINELDLYLSERVKELTNNRQTPTTTKPQTIQDFPVAVIE